MGKKFRSRLSVKLFLGIAITLIVFFFLMFQGVRYLLPTLYEREITHQFREFTVEILDKLFVLPFDEIEDFVTRVSVENNFNVMVSVDGQTFEAISFNVVAGEEDIIEWAVDITNSVTGLELLVVTQAGFNSVNQVSNVIDGIMPFLFGLSFILSILIAGVISVYLSRPIVRISETSKKMRQLNLSERSKIRRSDEIGELADNLNHMAEDLEQALDDLQTELVQRSELFTGISHELKTPITILKGELEGMIHKVGIYQDREKYLKHAYETAESMERLVQEILIVSQLEMKSFKLSFQKGNISLLVQDVCQRHEELATRKNIELISYCEEETLVYLDAYQIQNAISNIISNAIFHSPSGEVIDVQLLRIGNQGKLTVENSGARIEEEDLAHVFEPFYRADKSRNRHTGGSGLGLSMVKRILDLHGFEYRIENSEDGVLFTVVFPLSSKMNEGMTL